MTNEVTVTIRKKPNGIAMDIGEQKYMYFTPQEFIAGPLLHFGCQETKHINLDELDCLLEAMALWSKNKGQYIEKAEAIRDNRMFKKKYSELHSSTFQLKHRLVVAEKQIEALKKENEKIRTIYRNKAKTVIRQSDTATA